MTTSLWVLRILMFLPTTFRYRWLPGWKFLWLLIRWKDLLSLIDNLNFACQIIPAGRIFLCCFTDLSTTARLPHHHITMNLEACGDMELPCYYSRPLLVQITQLALFTDASGTLGCGMVFTNDGHQIANSRPAILRDHLVQWEELYPIALSCLLWRHLWSGKKILFHCDYQPVVDIWASGTSQDPHIMYLDHSIFFSGATHNFIVLVSHIVGTDNSIADFLSCL